MSIEFYCISLTSRQDRREAVQKLFDQLAIKVNWWIVEKHPSGGVFGCAESHLSIWSQQSQGTSAISEFICVFEDDIELFEDDSARRFKRCIRDILKNGCRGYDLLNLEPGVGYYEDEGFLFSKKIKDEFRAGFATRTGCYIAERGKLKRLAERLLPKFGMDIDLALYGDCKMAVVVVPIFRQNKEFGTDNTGGVHDLGTYVSNYGLEFSRETFSLLPGLGRLYMNCMTSLSRAYSGKGKSVELKDRRVITK